MADYRPTIPIRVRTARKQYVCDGWQCKTPIFRGDRYEDHRLPPNDADVCNTHWLKHKIHAGGSGSGTGCDEAAAYAEQAAREQADG